MGGRDGVALSFEDGSCAMAVGSRGDVQAQGPVKLLLIVPQDCLRRLSSRTGKRHPFPLRFIATTEARPMFDEGDLIHSYTRAGALRDGVLIDVSATAKEAGFNYPVALTRAAW